MCRRSGSNRNVMNAQWLALLFMAAACFGSGELTCQDSLPTAQCETLLHQVNGNCSYVSTSVESGSSTCAFRVGDACRRTCGLCDIPASGALYDSQDTALRALNRATNGGDGWNEAEGWLDPSIGHCNWRGVFCDSSGSVTHL